MPFTSITRKSRNAPGSERTADWSKRIRRKYPSYEMESSPESRPSNFTLWKNLLLEFVPERVDLHNRDKDAYDTCAKVLGEHSDMFTFGSVFENTTPGESYEKAPYPQYMMFAREVAGLIREAENIDACTFEAINDRVNRKRLLEGFPQQEDLHMKIGELIEEMTLLTEFYSFLPRRMWGIQKKEDLGLGKYPRILFQRLGLFEEDDPNAPRAVFKPFRGEIPTADCLCDVLGVKIDWTMSLADHLIFDEPKRQLTLFALPSFCKINQQSLNGVLRRILNFLSIPGQESEKPTVDTRFLNEVVQSYEAIFPDDKSRKHFLQVEKPKLEGQGDIFDPYLLHLCGEAPERRLPYLVEFRVFRRRLIILENFAKSAVPKRGRSLWKDQRNLEKSITFKAVIVFGSLGVIIGLIQILLSILQVAYAIKAA